MQSRFNFREHGQVIRTRSGAGLADAAYVAGAIAGLLGLLAWGHARDQAEPDRGAFEAGLAVGHDDMQQAVGDAYRQGRVDAAAELGSRPVGCTVPAEQAPKAAPMLLRGVR